MSENHYQLFGLPVAFEVDGETLALRYRDLQKAVHPDRFAGASERERLLSVQQASRINEAFRTLKDPLARARYLLELNGITLSDTDTGMDPMFLMEQMELREALDEARAAADPFAALNKVRDQAEATERQLLEELAALFATGDPAALQGGPERLRKLQFMRKLLDEVDEREEDLVHGNS